MTKKKTTKTTKRAAKGKSITSIHLPPADKAKIKRAAKKAGKPFTRYIREAALKAAGRA